MKGWALGFIAALTVILAQGVAGGFPVKVPNGGAEEADGKAPGMPAKASTYVSAEVQAEFSRDTREKHSGEASFHIVNRGRPEAPKDAPQNAVFILEVNVIPGLTYRVNGFVKMEGCEEASLVARPRSKDGWVDITPYTEVLRDAHDWTGVASRFRAPKTATHIQLLVAAGGKGQAWFDDIRVEDDFESAAPKRCEEVLAKLKGLDLEGLEEDDGLAAVRKALDGAQALAEETRAAAAGDAAPFEKRREILARADEIEAVYERHARPIALRQALRRAGAVEGGEPGYIVGFAPSTVHVFLEDRPIRMEVEPKPILAVRGETEATQLVIHAHGKGLRGVKVSVSDLKSGDKVLPASLIEIKPVGFVRIEKLAPCQYGREAEYSGWWPDPVFPNFAFDVEKGTTQPVWIEVHVPADAPSGLYEGEVEARPADAAALKAKLAVRVADVTLPEKWYFRTGLGYHEDWGKQFYGARWDERMREAFIEFLLARRINLTSTYENEPYETPENLVRFARRGQNALLAAWIQSETRMNTSSLAALRARLDSIVPAIREAGFIDRCYVYGWDEKGPEWHGEIRTCAELLQEKYPGVQLLTARTDPTYGTDSTLTGLSNIAFCPDMPFFKVELAARAKATGSEVWWYDTWWTIDDHLIRGRMIPWQTWKAGADGFMFWCINRWRGNEKPVFDAARPAIRTEWNPALDGVKPYSSAMYVYPGADGPVSSLRLENLRDGIEDYALLALAREMLEAAEKKGEGGAELAQLRGAITLEDGFVAGARDYSTDPEALATHREALIEAIARNAGKRAGE
ncbi:MAG: glycoside hydrolase domain-containing protein [Planctomycetota bacterium]